jgi:protein SCO1/2
MSRRAAIASVLIVAALLLALALSLALGHSSSSPSGTSAASGGATGTGFDGAEIPPGAPARDFTLTDQDGRAVSLSSYRGQVVVLSFLYSHCGPSCIVIAQQIRGALDDLPHPVPVLIVSADPTGDTPASVRRFLAQMSLSGRVRYLSGPLARLRPIWKAYGVTPASAGQAAFDRFASVALLDRRGSERVLFESEQLTPESLAHDIGKLQGG